MTWLEVILVMVLAAYILRIEIIAFRLGQLESEIRDVMRPRSHEHGNEIQRLIADVENLENRHKK